jgi:hypothetical protein
MEPSLHDYVVEKLNGAKGRWPLVATQTGVSRRTIEKIASRLIKDPGITNMEKLAQYFRVEEPAP